MIKEVIQQIPATDGFLLEARIYQPSVPIKAIVQINSAAGVSKGYYTKFSHFLASRGFLVVTFDYRGIGGSSPDKMRGFEAYCREWGEKDMTGIQHWITENYPEKPKLLIGHSIGGTLTGLMANNQNLQAIILVASPSGYWKLHPMPTKYLRLAAWYVILPILVAWYGYAPLKRLGVMEDIPKGVVQEWGDWCTHPQYLKAFFGKTIAQPFYNAVKAPILSLELADDDTATPLSIPPILDLYQNASIERVLIQPSDVNTQEIGHLGFFRSRFEKTLWNKPLNWFEDQLKK